MYGPASQMELDRNGHYTRDTDHRPGREAEAAEAVEAVEAAEAREAEAAAEAAGEVMGFT